MRVWPQVLDVFVGLQRHWMDRLDIINPAAAVWRLQSGQLIALGADSSHTDTNPHMLFTAQGLTFQPTGERKAVCKEKMKQVLLFVILY